MEPINSERQKQLEQMLKTCPFTGQAYRFGLEEWSAFGTGITIYLCFVDGGPARGAKVFKQNSFEGNLEPCPMTYAVTCPLYQQALKALRAVDSPKKTADPKGDISDFLLF